MDTLNADTGLFTFFLQADLLSTAHGKNLGDIVVVASSVYQENPNTESLGYKDTIIEQDHWYTHCCTRGADTFWADAQMLAGKTDVMTLSESFTRRTAYPTLLAWDHFKNDRAPEAKKIVASIQDHGWRAACKNWLEMDWGVL
jgi:hypothetical protein